MCESNEGSGEAARMLRLVWTLTDKICHVHTHCVYVWEQWRLWQDCMHIKSRLSIDWKNMPYVRPFRACARAVKAFVSTLNVLRSKLTYYAYKKKTNEAAHGKLYLSQRQTVKVLMRMCICVVASVSLSLVHKNMNVIVCIHYGLLNHLKIIRPRTLFVWWLTIGVWLKSVDSDVKYKYNKKRKWNQCNELKKI